MLPSSKLGRRRIVKNIKPISKASRHGNEMTDVSGYVTPYPNASQSEIMYGVSGVAVVQSLEAVQGALLLALPVGVVKSSHAGLEVCALCLHT